MKQIDKGIALIPALTVTYAIIILKLVMLENFSTKQKHAKIGTWVVIHMVSNRFWWKCMK